MKNWIKGGPFNQVLEGKGFFISYNPRPGQMFGGWVADDGGDETALVRTGKGRNTYYILNGDFRKDYEKLINDGFVACKKFYDKKRKKFKSSWSTE